MYEEAAREFQKAAKELLWRHKALSGQARCMVGLGRTEDAVRLYEEALQSPGISLEEELESKYRLARAHLAEGNKDSGRRILEEIQRRRPGFKDVQELLQEL